MVDYVAQHGKQERKHQVGIITKHEYSPDDRDGWLSLRESLDRVGGSELGIIAGHSQYSSPFALFCKKAGFVEKEDISDKESVIQGHDLEQYVAERFERVSGKKVEVFPFILTNSDSPHLEATVDRMVVGESSGLECKTMQSVVMRKFKNGDFPLSYYDQCVSYLAVSELDRWYLAILVFGTAFKVFLMTTDEEEYERYQTLRDKVEGAKVLDEAEQKEWASKFGWLESVCFISKEEKSACEILAAKFMSRVQDLRNGNADAWPMDEIDGSDSTKETLAKISPKAMADTIVTFDEASEYGLQEDGEAFIAAKASDVISLVKQRMEIVEAQKQLEQEQAEIENRIRAIMNDKEIFQTPDCKVTNRNVKGRVTASATAVQEYFAANNQEVPQGLVNCGKEHRELKFYVSKGSSKKSKK